MAVQIPLTQGKVAIVDHCDADLVGVKWSARMRSDGLGFYATRNIRSNGKRRQIQEQMHRVILERMIGRPLRKGEFCDHIDGNGIRNVRSNLRLANRIQNGCNRRLGSNNSSGFKGVTWAKSRGKWKAQIKVKDKLKFLGYFDTPAEAHAAYCEAARKYHGEFANFGTAQS